MQILAESVRSSSWTHVTGKRSWTLHSARSFTGPVRALMHLRRTRGNVVNTESISGLAASHCFSAYYAAKGGVVNFTRYLAVEHAHEGI